MKSIYSLGALQRILDHWGVGKIETYDYFDSVGKNIWRHWLETNRGIFELYSYVPEESQYAEQKLLAFLGADSGGRFEMLHHCFDRYQVLQQLARKELVSPKQLKSDLDLLLEQTLVKGFRVYGTILQLEFEKSTLSAYSNWSIHRLVNGEEQALVNSGLHSVEQLDSEIEKLILDHPSVLRYVQQSDWFELYLTSDLSLHFRGSHSFEAVTLNNRQRTYLVRIFDEKKIWYQWDVK